ncbi:cytochrome b [Bradyrhizobium guangxiense]|uniref:cytochrome b n=1 Tax=Bradyrhizobium guangxiense TaxID=1325115 RepID=UPI001008D2BE|nr:cytochrome b [Bradyrhizobium guangxiense]
MRLFNSAKGYGAIAQALHWFTVVLVVLAWTLGVFADLLPKGEPRHAGLVVHISTGILIIVLVLARLVSRSVSSPPALAASEFGAWLGKWVDPVARIMHYILYALLVAVPLTGIVLQFARGDALSLLGLATIPSPWLKDAVFAHNVKEVHEIIAHSLVILAMIHAGAALIHHWVFRDNTLLRMLPHTEDWHAHDRST